MQDSEVKSKNKEISEEADSKVYELGYLLVPTIKEEDVPVQYGNLKELISGLGGELISDEMPKMIPLAYQMSKVVSNLRHKFDSAYFGWVKFVMEADKLLELKSRLDSDTNFIRFLILKTVKENTIAGRRFMQGGAYRRSKARTSNNEPAVPINKEEIDKEIEAMVAS